MVDLRILGLILINIIHIGRRCSWLGGRWAGRLHRLWTWYLPAWSSLGGSKEPLPVPASECLCVFKFENCPLSERQWHVDYTYFEVDMTICPSELVDSWHSVVTRIIPCCVSWVGVMLGFVRGVFSKLCFETYHVFLFKWLLLPPSIQIFLIFLEFLTWLW